jgi:hypothetical protein
MAIVSQANITTPAPVLPPPSDSRAPRKAKARKTKYYDEDDEDDDDYDDDGPDEAGEWTAVRRAQQHVRSPTPPLLAFAAS